MEDGALKAKVELLEELIEFNIREAREMEHVRFVAGNHYTYTDKMISHRYAAADLEHRHRELLRYPESSKRLNAIRERVELDMNDKYPDTAPMSIEDEHVYNVAQNYRNAPLTDQKRVSEAFKNMVDTIWNKAIDAAMQMQRKSGGGGIISALKRQ
jgi:hypothetical protein